MFDGATLFDCTEQSSDRFVQTMIADCFSRPMFSLGQGAKVLCSLAPGTLLLRIGDCEASLLLVGSGKDERRS